MNKIYELMAKGKEAKGNSTISQHIVESKHSPWNATSLSYEIANDFPKGKYGTQQEKNIATTFIIDNDKLISQDFKTVEKEVGVYRFIPGNNFLAVVVEEKDGPSSDYPNRKYIINQYANDKRKALYLLIDKDRQNLKLYRDLIGCVVSKL